MKNKIKLGLTLIFILLIQKSASVKKVTVLIYDNEKAIRYKDQIYIKDNTIPFNFEEAESSMASGAAFWFYVILTLIITLFAGIMSGLTVGYLSIDELILEIKSETGNEEEKKWAKNIEPVIANHHWLLVSLLLCNSAAMETMPLVLNNIVSEFMAVLISVTLVLFFGEIIPQALCTGKNQLKIGSICAPLTLVLMWITSPLSYPLALFIDWVIGKHSKSRFRNSDLKALIKLHTTEAIEQLKREEEEANIGDDVGLTNDQVNVMLGALDVTNKSVKDFMVPYENVYNISIDEPLTESVLKKIMNKGFSRIPVYKGDPHQVIGLLRVKQLLNLKIDYTQNKSLKDIGVKLNHPLVVSPEMKAIDLLNEFKKGKSHMAFITTDVLMVQEGCGLNRQNSFIEPLEQLKYDNLGASYLGQSEKKVKILGILTLEDVIEKMISIEIMDEDDYNKAKMKKKKALLKLKTEEAIGKEIVKNIQTQSLVDAFIEGNKEKLGGLINNPNIDESEKQPLNNEFVENDYQLLNNQI